MLLEEVLGELRKDGGRITHESYIRQATGDQPAELQAYVTSFTAIFDGKEVKSMVMAHRSGAVQAWGFHMLTQEQLLGNGFSKVDK